MVSTSSLRKGRSLVLSFPLSKLLVIFGSAKMLCNQCKLSTYRILRQSKNLKIKRLYTITTSKHINHDCLIKSVSLENRNQVLSYKHRVDRRFNKSVFNHSWNKFMNLNGRQVLLRQILKVCPVKVINM